VVGSAFNHPCVLPARPDSPDQPSERHTLDSKPVGVRIRLVRAESTGTGFCLGSAESESGTTGGTESTRMRSAAVRMSGPPAIWRLQGLAFGLPWCKSGSRQRQ